MQTVRYDDFALVALDSETALLTADFTLFSASNNEPHFWQTVAPVNRAMHQRYGLDATVLRCIDYRVEPDCTTNIYIMEAQRPFPQGMRVTRADFDRIHDPLTREILTRWFESDQTAGPPWYQAGWFARQREKLMETASNIEQMRSWERSAVVRGTTKNGYVYLKSIPPMFAHEVKLTEWLYAQDAAHFPAVLRAEGHDLLMADYGGTPLMEMPSVDLWADALRLYAEKQVQFADCTDELSALGVPMRDLDWLAAGLDRLLHDESALRSGFRPLTDEQIGQLRAINWRESCAALANAPIPLSLEHGDLWTGQIIARDGDFIFTDWSDSAITHPWFSLPFFLAEIDNELPGVPGAREQIRAAYLAAWRGFADDETLLALYPHAARLSPLYTALRYYADILPAMQTNQWEMENMLTYNLRLALR